MQRNSDRSDCVLCDDIDVTACNAFCWRGRGASPQPPPACGWSAPSGEAPAGSPLRLQQFSLRTQTGT